MIDIGQSDNERVSPLMSLLVIARQPPFRIIVIRCSYTLVDNNDNRSRATAFDARLFRAKFNSMQIYRKCTCREIVDDLEFS